MFQCPPLYRLQVDNLTEGQWYAYRVKALNRLGASKPSKPTDEILATDPKGMKYFHNDYLMLYCVM